MSFIRELTIHRAKRTCKEALLILVINAVDELGGVVGKRYFWFAADHLSQVDFTLLFWNATAL